MKKFLVFSLGVLSIYLLVDNARLKGQNDELKRNLSDINSKADKAERYIGKLLIETKLQRNERRKN